MTHGGGIIGFNDLTPDYNANNTRNALNTQQVISELNWSYSSIRIEKKRDNFSLVTDIVS